MEIIRFNGSFEETGPSWQHLPSMNILFAFHERFFLFFFRATFRLETRLLLMKTWCINDIILQGIYTECERQMTWWKDTSGQDEIKGRVSSSGYCSDMGDADIMTKLRRYASSFRQNYALASESKATSHYLGTLITFWLNLSAPAFTDKSIYSKRRSFQSR